MNPRPGLQRVVGVGGVAFTTFNCIVGVGIFALPALVAGVLGAAAILAYGICLVLIGLVGLCFAEAGSRVTGSGGLYAYASASFGPVAGGVVGALMLFTSQVASAGALARFLLDTLAITWPALAAPGVDFALLAAIFGVLAVVNIAGTRGGTRLTVVIGLVKLALLAFVTMSGLVYAFVHRRAGRSRPPVEGVGGD